jgi:metal-dependent HD superfamily phosphatase/phosphodiesterase
MEGKMIMETKKYANIDIRVPTNRNRMLARVLALINEDVEVKTLWRINNINAIDRLGITDHGVVHFQIVANIALRLARILDKYKVGMSISRDYDPFDRLRRTGYTTGQPVS